MSLKRKKNANLKDPKDSGNMGITAVVIMDFLATMNSTDIMDFPDSLDLIGNIERDLTTKEVFLMVKKAE
jgi:hypothetical protein